MKNDADNLSRSASQQYDTDQPASLQGQQRHQQNQQNYSSSCSSLTSGIGHSDQSICTERLVSSSITDLETGSLNNKSSYSSTIDRQDIDPNLRADIKKFVDDIFTDSQSISLEKKAEFGKLVRSPDARFLFASFVDDYRVNSKRVSELTFYSLAQYFSIVLLECLLAEDFRPAKIIMNMMFTYYYEQRYDKLPPEQQLQAEIQGQMIACDSDDADTGGSKKVKAYLYTLLKEQQIFKSIRFWTSAFYESVVIERNNHPVFVDRERGMSNSERRNEELDCSKNITFGLLGSFIHNMSLLGLSHEFCREFLDKHSTIAGLSDDQLEMLRSNMKSMFVDSPDDKIPASGGEKKLTTFLQKLSNKLNQSSSLTH